MIYAEDMVNNELSAMELIDIIRGPSQSISKRHLSPVPTIYYIGLGKTGTSSLLGSFPEHSVARWHSIVDFEKVHHTDYLTRNNLHLYECVLMLCEPFGIKPLIIECIRDPVARTISRHVDGHRRDSFEECVACLEKDGFDMEPHSVSWPKYFGVELQRYVETDRAKLLFLKFDQIRHRRDVFSKIGYKFITKHRNATKHKTCTCAQLYNRLKREFKLPVSRLREIYSQPIIRQWYSSEEIEKFISRWAKKARPKAGLLSLCRF